MQGLGKHWLLCGALALPIGFGIGYVLDAKLPAYATTYVEPSQQVPVIAPPSPHTAPAPERISTKQPERAAPPPAVRPPAPEKAATPPPAPPPVVQNEPIKPPVKPAPRAKGPRLDFEQGSIGLDGDTVRIRTPYGSFSFDL